MATSISNVTGTFGLNNSLVISGSGFGAKIRSKPQSYCDFQNGSLQPNSAVSNNTSLASLQNVSYVSSAEKRWGNGGVGSASWLRNSTASGNSATLQVATTWGPTNRNLFIFAWRKWLNADTSGNWKTWRFWPGTDGGGGYPDSYLGAPAIEGPGGWVWSIEGVSFTNDVNHKWLAAGLQPTSTWRSEMLVMKHPSSTAAVDGALNIYFNGLGGTVVTEDSDFSFSFPGANATSNVVYLQDTKASSNPGGSMQSFYGDFYVDDSHNQVFMGNASTFAACNHIEIQPFTAWADGSITITQRPGTFSSGTGTYLYVTDANFNPNSIGYQLNNLNQNPTPPTLVSISPTSGKAVGGTSITGTCTGLTASLNGVTVGGTACTSVVRVNSTSFTAVAPAKAAGLYSVVVTNSDTTTGTLLSGYTSVAAPVVSSVVTIGAAVGHPASVNTAPHASATTQAFGKTAIITGTGFLPGATVAVGGLPATAVVVNSTTQITCFFPGLGNLSTTTNQVFNVVVTNTDGQTSGASGNGKWSVSLGTSATDTPWIYNLPLSGSTLGADPGPTMIVGGAQAGFTLTFGGTPAIGVGILANISGYNLQVVEFGLPAHAAGAVDVVLTNLDASTYTFTNGFTYVVANRGFF